MRHKVEDQWGCCHGRSEDEDETVFPETLEEVFVGEDEERQERDQNERRQTVGDIGVQADTKDESSQKEGAEAFGAQAFEKEIERKGQEKRHHDSPKANA